jgi:hypothetical protein
MCRYVNGGVRNLGGRTVLTASTQNRNLAGMVRRLTLGTLISATLAFVAAGGSFFGIAAWKIALAVVGFLVFVSARSRA